MTLYKIKVDGHVIGTTELDAGVTWGELQVERRRLAMEYNLRTQDIKLEEMQT